MLTPSPDPNLTAHEWILEDGPVESPRVATGPTRHVHFEFSRRPFRFQFGLLDLAALFVTVAGLLTIGRWIGAYPGLFWYFFGLCVLVGLLVFPAIFLMVAACGIQAIDREHRVVRPLMEVASWLILIGVAAWLVFPVIFLALILIFLFVRRSLKRLLLFFQRGHVA